MSDTKLRKLERRWRATGSVLDANNYFREVFRSAGEAIDLYSWPRDSFRNPELTRFLQSGAFNHQLLIDGANVQELLDHPFLQRHQREEDFSPREPIFVCMCLGVDETRDNRRVPRVAVYTLSRSKINCPACNTAGPHQCHNFRHPFHNGRDLYPPLPNDYRGDDYYRQNLIRDWYPTQTIRQVGQAYQCVIHQWIFDRESIGELMRADRFTGYQERSPVDNAAHRAGPWFVTMRRWDSWTDLNRYGVNNIGGRSFKNLCKPTIGHSMRYTLGPCAVLMDKVKTAIRVNEHGPIEPVPKLVVGPCQDFDIIPRGEKIFIPELLQWVPTGGTISIIDPMRGNTERVIDTSTTCGHGYIFNQFDPETHDIPVPLCPPVWSDGYLQNKVVHCNTCHYIVPADSIMAGFPRCRDCVDKQEKRRAVTEEHRFGDLRNLYEEAYQCPNCEHIHEHPDDVEDCCGEEARILINCYFCDEAYPEFDDAVNCCTQETFKVYN